MGQQLSLFFFFLSGDIIQFKCFICLSLSHSLSLSRNSLWRQHRKSSIICLVFWNWSLWRRRVFYAVLSVSVPVPVLSSLFLSVTLIIIICSLGPPKMLNMLAINSNKLCVAISITNQTSVGGRIWRWWWANKYEKPQRKGCGRGRGRKKGISRKIFVKIETCSPHTHTHRLHK